MANIRLTECGKKINEAIIEDWIRQGHKLTSAFETALREPDGVRVEGDTVEGWGREYWKYINFGVKPENIKWPFAGARIRGLTRYLKLRKGLNDKEARSMAYAVATKHKREGMPQPFSSRTKYVESAIDRIRPEVDKIIDLTIGEIMDKEIAI